MRYIESAAVAAMLICGALALAGCTAASLMTVFVAAATVRAAIEMRNMIKEAG